MSSRDIKDLRPEFLFMVDQWLLDAHTVGLDLLITCTTRSGGEQDALYAKGRTVMGEHATPEHPMGLVRTNAKSGQSAHQYGLALDFVIMEHGKPDWSGDSEPWNRAINLAKARGLQSLRPMESAHLQHPSWKSLITQGVSI